MIHFAMAPLCVGSFLNLHDTQGMKSIRNLVARKQAVIYNMEPTIEASKTTYDFS